MINIVLLIITAISSVAGLMLSIYTLYTTKKRFTVRVDADKLFSFQHTPPPPDKPRKTFNERIDEEIAKKKEGKPVAPPARETII